MPYAKPDYFDEEVHPNIIHWTLEYCSEIPLSEIYTSLFHIDGTRLFREGDNVSSVPV